MAIDQSTSNQTRYASAPNSDLLSLPNGDWTWLFCFYPQGPYSTKDPYLIANNTWGQPNSYNFYLDNASGEIKAKVNTNSSADSGATVNQNEWHLGYVTRRSDNVYSGIAGIDDTGYAQEGTGIALTSGTVTTGTFFIGSAESLSSTRYYQGRWSHVIYIPGVSTTIEDAQQIAKGRPLDQTKYWARRTFHALGRSADHAKFSDLTGNHILTLQGSSYGTNEHDPDQIVLHSPRNNKIYVPALFGAAATQADLTASGTGAFSADGNVLFKSDVSAAGTGATSIDANALFKADLSSTGTGAFSGDTQALFRADVAADGTGVFSGDFSALSSGDVSASGLGAFSGNFSALSSGDLSADGVGVFTGVSAGALAELTASGIGSFSGDFSAKASTDVSADGVGAFSGDFSAKAGGEVTAPGAGIATIDIGAFANADLSAPGIGSSSLDSQLGQPGSELLSAGVGGFDADGSVFASSSLTATGVGTATVDITAIKPTEGTMAGVGAFAGDITARVPADANMPGQSITVINIASLFKADAGMAGVGSADFDLLQQGSLFTADGIGGAAFILGGTVPILHAVTIDLEKYSETIDLEKYSETIDLTA